LKLKENKMQPAPSIGSKYKSEFIDGMVKRDEHFIMI